MDSISRRRAIAVLGLGALGACTRSRADLADPTSSTTTTAPPPTGPTTTVTLPSGTTLVARAEVDVIDVFADATTADVARQIDRRQQTTGNLVFVVIDEADDPDGRHLVELPVRPNGSTGWVPAADVSLTVHDYRIRVELTAHRLEVRKGDEVLVASPIGVGTQDTPTPGGVYYVKELLRPPVPDGPYGPYAYGLSGFSNVLESFAGGEGVIGIHGTNQPDLVGTDVSSGCIRLPNEVILRLVEEIQLPLGVPVEIVA